MHTRWRLGDDLMPIDTNPKFERPGLVTTVAQVLFLAAIDAAIRHRAERARRGEESWSDPAMPTLVPLEGTVLPAKSKYRDRDAERRALLEEIKQRRDPLPVGFLLATAGVTLAVAFAAIGIPRHSSAAAPALAQSHGTTSTATRNAAASVPDDQRNFERETAMSFFRAKLVEAVAPAFKNDAPDRAPQGGRR